MVTQQGLALLPAQGGQLRKHGHRHSHGNHHGHLATRLALLPVQGGQLRHDHDPGDDDDDMIFFSPNLF